MVRNGKSKDFLLRLESSNYRHRFSVAPVVEEDIELWNPGIRLGDWGGRVIQRGDHLIVQESHKDTDFEWIDVRVISSETYRELPGRYLDAASVEALYHLVRDHQQSLAEGPTT